MRSSDESKKARGDAVLKNMGDALQEEFYQLLRRTTQAKAITWLREVHGIETTPGSVTDFWQWYPRQCVLRQAARSSTNLETAIQNMPQLKISAQQARAVAQVNFELQAAENRDPELYAMLTKADIERERLRLDREKFEHTKKSDVEKGLEALHAEIKGNAEALKHFEALKRALGGRS